MPASSAHSWKRPRNSGPASVLRHLAKPKVKKIFLSFLMTLSVPPVFPKFLANVKFEYQSTRTSHVSPSKWQRSADIFSMGYEARSSSSGGGSDA